MKLRTTLLGRVVGLALGCLITLPTYAQEADPEPPEVQKAADPAPAEASTGETPLEVKKVQLSGFLRLSQYSMTASDLVNNSSAKIESNLVPGFLVQGAYRFSDYWMVLVQVTGDFAKFKQPANKSLAPESHFLMNSKIGAIYFTEQDFYVAGELLLGHQVLGVGRTAASVELDRFLTPGVGFRAGYWWAPEEKITLRPEVGFSANLAANRTGYRYRYGLNYQAGLTALYAATDAMALRGGFTFVHHSDEANIISQSRTDYVFEFGTTINTDWF